MITKITRRQLRQLINEALKPFFMGVPPSNIISRLLKDPRIDGNTKELLSHPDLEIQRTGITLIQDPDILASYPELDDIDIAAPELMPDLIDRSQPVYREEFDDAQLRMSDIALRSSMGFDSNATPDQKIELIDKHKDILEDTIFFLNTYCLRQIQFFFGKTSASKGYALRWDATYVCMYVYIYI